jgi:lysosomal acid lipase/cholesteryl ester hydrolase
MKKGDINNQEDPSKPVVLLLHGYFDSSDAWVMNGNNSPAIYFVNKGYDVWLGNNRGNKYSINHKTLNYKDPKFWYFSFPEMGKYDLPAMVDYIIGKTGRKKISFIGHSQGNT